MRKIALVLMVLVMVFATAAHAQTVPAACGGLNNEDCAILTRASELELTRTAGSFTLFMDFRLSDRGETMAVAVDATGSYSLDGEIPTIDQTTAMSMNTIEQLNLVVDVLRAADAQLNMTLTLPAGALPGVNKLDVNLLLVDGFGYVDFDTLQPVLNDPSLRGWGGLDIANLMEALIEEMAPLLDMQQSGVDEIDPALLETFADPAFLDSMIRYTRLDDGSGDMAMFEAQIDIGAMYNSEAFRALMLQQFAAQGMPMTDAEFDDAMAMIMPMFNDMAMMFRQTIDLDTGYMTQMVMNISFDFGSMGMIGTGMEFAFTINFTDFNAASVISAPANAAILPYQMLISLMGSGGF